MPKIGNGNGNAEKMKDQLQMKSIFNLIIFFTIFEHLLKEKRLCLANLFFLKGH